MPMRPLTEAENKHYEDEIKRLRDEINIRQQTVDYFNERLKEGEWVSDIKWGVNK
jgi:hypothetical protein